MAHRINAGRVITCLAGVSLLAASVSAQVSSNKVTDATGLSPEAKEWLDPSLLDKEAKGFKIPKWDFNLNLTTGAGYKDNVILSYQHPQASGFSRAGMEMTLLRLPVNGWQFYVYCFGEDIRYFSAEAVSKEQTALALAQLKKDLGKRWQLSLTANYLYIDQVMDVSASQEVLSPLPVVGHAILPKLGLRRDFARSLWWEAEFEASRQIFRRPLDSYWEGGPRMTLGMNYGDKSDLSVSCEFGKRFYDQRLQTDVDGFGIPGTHLASEQQRLQINWHQHLDAKCRWRLATRLGLERSLDNGAGYYDYWKYYASEQLRYRDERLELRGQVRLARYDYAVQTVAPYGDKLLDRTGLATGVRGEFKLSKVLRLFVEYEYEQNASSLLVNQYTVNTVNGGLYWEF